MILQTIDRYEKAFKEAAKSNKDKVYVLRKAKD
jgi:hypothetical protein